MEVIQSVAEHEEQKECKTMGESQRQLDEALGRLEELSAYRQMYVSRGGSKKGVHATQWQDYHKFINRLDQAVAAQEKIVSDGRLQREAHQKRWMMKRQRLESLSRVVDRFKQVEADATERQLQKQTDAQPLRPGPYDRNH